MARTFTYKGKTIEELQKLDMNEYAKIVDSRQRRALKRMSSDYKALLKKVAEAKAANSTKTIKTQIREAVIIPSWVGMKFGVHTGKEFKEFVIEQEMLGHRLGEFAFSTKRVLHSAPGIRATRGSKFLAVK
jgi:small subunit ribosomal protein S19